MMRYYVIEFVSLFFAISFFFFYNAFSSKNSVYPSLLLLPQSHCFLHPLILDPFPLNRNPQALLLHRRIGRIIHGKVPRRFDQGGLFYLIEMHVICDSFSIGGKEKSKLHRSLGGLQQSITVLDTTTFI